MTADLESINPIEDDVLPPLRTYVFIPSVVGGAFLLTLLIAIAKRGWNVLSLRAISLEAPHFIANIVLVTAAVAIAYCIYWRVRGCNFSFQPGHWLLLTLILPVLSALLSAQAFNFLFQVPMKYTLFGNHALKFVVSAVVFWFASRQIEETAEWRGFFKGLLAIIALGFLLGVLAWIFGLAAMSSRNAEVPAIFAVVPVSMMVGGLLYGALAVVALIVIAILGILAIRSDLDALEFRHWTHWVGVINWPLMMVLPFLTR